MTYDDHKKHIDAELARLTKSIGDLVEVVGQLQHRLDALEHPEPAPHMTPEEFSELCRQVHAARPAPSINDLFGAGLPSVGGAVLPSVTSAPSIPFPGSTIVCGGEAMPQLPPGVTFR